LGIVKSGRRANHELWSNQFGKGRPKGMRDGLQKRMDHEGGGGTTGFSPRSEVVKRKDGDDVKVKKKGVGRGENRRRCGQSQYKWGGGKEGRREMKKKKNEKSDLGQRGP